jgi:hypothetical protein
MKHNFKPFNLEAALKGDPVVTRDGRSVRIIHVPEKAPFSVLYVDEGGCHDFVKKDGYHSSCNRYDLLMAPKKKTLYVNFYEDSLCSAYYYDSEAEARVAVDPTIPRLAEAVPVEIEV